MIASTKDRAVIFLIKNKNPDLIRGFYFLKDHFGG